MHGGRLRTSQFSRVEIRVQCEVAFVGRCGGIHSEKNASHMVSICQSLACRQVY